MSVLEMQICENLIKSDSHFIHRPEWVECLPIADALRLAHLLVELPVDSIVQVTAPTQVERAQRV